MEAGDRDSGLRLAELLAAFSLTTDLGLGQPMEHVLRSWLIARRLGDRLGLGAGARASLYYVMMLAWVGCVADSTEVAAWFGDDIAFRADSYQVDFAGLPMMGFALSHAGAGGPFLHRLHLAASLVLTGGRAVERGLMAHCLSTTQMARRLGLPDEVCLPLRQVFTRWDAKGVPDGVGGEQITAPARLFHLADTVEVGHRQCGVGKRVHHVGGEPLGVRAGVDGDPLAQHGAVTAVEPHHAGRHRGRRGVQGKDDAHERPHCQTAILVSEWLTRSSRTSRCRSERRSAR